MKEKIRKVLYGIAIAGICVGGVVGFLVTSGLFSLDELWVNITLGVSGILLSIGIITFGLNPKQRSIGWIVAGIIFALMCSWMIISFFLV